MGILVNVHFSYLHYKSTGIEEKTKSTAAIIQKEPTSERTSAQTDKAFYHRMV